MIDHGRPIEILLVDDSESDVLLARMALEQGRLANTLHVVETGDGALDFVWRRGVYSDATVPDLILLDLNLPGIDGREVLAEIKAAEQLKRIPVVVMTSSSTDKDILESYGLHANSYVTKPVDFPQFATAIQKVTDYWFTVVSLPSRTSEA
jgi:two-component system response regulator